MGYNNDNATKLVFDIETAPLPDAAEYLTEPVEAPANYKDPVKIAAYVKDEQAKQLSKCGLDVDLCRIVAIGTWLEDSDPIADVARGGEADERSLLTAFWTRAADRHLVGFNCLGFDLPVLLRRSLYLDIPTPLIQIDRFKHPTVTDLMQVLSYNGALKFRGLSFYAKRFGLGIEDPFSGADIAAAVADQRWADVVTHVLADVCRTGLLATRLGLFYKPVAAVL